MWAPSRSAAGQNAARRGAPVLFGERRGAMAEAPVLIVGAGPTGLVLALWLAKAGIPVRIIDRAAEPGTASRAVGVQARTLEFYRQLGIAQEVVERGHQFGAANLWVGGRHRARA